MIRILHGHQALGNAGSQRYRVDLLSLSFSSIRAFELAKAVLMINNDVCLVWLLLDFALMRKYISVSIILVDPTTRYSIVKSISSLFTPTPSLASCQEILLVASCGYTRKFCDAQIVS
jgi:hypothetical protein